MYVEKSNYNSLVIIFSKSYFQTGYVIRYVHVHLHHAHLFITGPAPVTIIRVTSFTPEPSHLLGSRFGTDLAFIAGINFSFEILHHTLDTSLVVPVKRVICQVPENCISICYFTFLYPFNYFASRVLNSIGYLVGNIGHCLAVRSFTVRNITDSSAGCRITGLVRIRGGALILTCF